MVSLKSKVSLRNKELLLFSLPSDETIVISSVLCGCLILLIPLWLFLSYRNPTTKSVLYSGWIPVLSAMLISSLGGLVLSKTVTTFPGIAVYSPIINGNRPHPLINAVTPLFRSGW